MSKKKDTLIGAALSPHALPFEQIRPGDIGYAHSTGIIGFLIRFGTRSRWNHCFVIERVGPTPEKTIVIQAEARGVERASLASVDPGGFYAILPPPPGVSRKLVVMSAKSLVGEDYAFLVIFSLAIMLSTRFLRFALMRLNTVICSALTALCLHAGGWQKHWPNLYTVFPGQQALAHAASLALGEKT